MGQVDRLKWARGILVISKIQITLEFCKIPNKLYKPPKIQEKYEKLIENIP
jgi:hypothetical protein